MKIKRSLGLDDRSPGNRWRSVRRGLSLISAACLGAVGLLSVSTAPASATDTLANCTLETVSAAAPTSPYAVTVTAVWTIPANSWTGALAYCKVTGTIATSGPEGWGTVSFELDLPDAWNKKFLMSAPGGLAGSVTGTISNTDLAYARAQGYAYATTDEGHSSSDPYWMFSNDLNTSCSGSATYPACGALKTSAVADYYYRGTHEATIALKALTTTYYWNSYSSSISYSYYDGCSNGGRTGLVEATQYPDDFDGEIIGDAYMDIKTQVWGFNVTQSQFKPLDAFIPAGSNLLLAVSNAIMTHCDGLDGVVDGLIQNPAACNFDPNSMVTRGCTGASTGTCLTTDEANGLKQFISQIVTSGPGTYTYSNPLGNPWVFNDVPGGSFPMNTPVFPGSPVSDLFTGWTASTTTPATAPTAQNPWPSGTPPFLWSIATTVIEDFVEVNNQFVPSTYWGQQTANRISPAALQLFDQMTGVGDGYNVRALTDPWSGYVGSNYNKKIIMYHGYSDNVITSFRSVWFYEQLASVVGSYATAQNNVRLFMAPGMFHCGGGPGPNTFNTLQPLESWVEWWTAPDSIPATKYLNDDPMQSVVRSMPLCKFPEMASYSGSGNVDDGENWSCSPSDTRLLNVGLDGRNAGLPAPTPPAWTKPTVPPT